jgi:hypothetical protein
MNKIVLTLLSEENCLCHNDLSQSTQGLRNEYRIYYYYQIINYHYLLLSNPGFVFYEQ